MPRIELELSPRVWSHWQSFLASQQGARLKEAGVLGDWALLALMANVDRYLKEGPPPAIGEPSKEQLRDQEHSSARRKLSGQQKRVLPMFNENESITAAEAARVLGLPMEQGPALMESWVAEGFLVPAGADQRGSTYTLAPDWQERNLAANRPSLNAPRVLYGAQVPENLK